MRTDLVHFYSDGCRLAGRLNIPDGATVENKSPCIVLCHGFTGIKESILPQYAEAFVEFVVFAEN